VDPKIGDGVRAPLLHTFRTAGIEMDGLDEDPKPNTTSLEVGQLPDPAGMSE
jgi:hypothetical protein